MGDGTTIEWTDATWNPITGCTLVSEGCRHCYAARLAATRLKDHPSRKGLARVNAAGEAKFTGEVRLNEQWLDQPLRWKKPRMIFVCAHGDLFHEGVPDEWIDRVFAVMALAPQHTFQVLTKRPERMRAYMSEGRGGAIARSIMDMWIAGSKPVRAVSATNDWPVKSIGDVDLPDDITLQQWPLPNVWLGTSVEDQPTADERIPHLLATPAAIRFISAEPLLGPVNLLVTDARGHDISALRGVACDPTNPDGADAYYRTAKLDWVIVGGESGPGARPMHPDWARSLRDQCAAAGVAFYFKQWGEWAPMGDFGVDPAANAAYRGELLRLECKDPEADAPLGISYMAIPSDDRESGDYLRCVGKARAGRLLDCVEHNGMPANPAPG
jgi:protein gp37